MGFNILYAYCQQLSSLNYKHQQCKNIVMKVIADLLIDLLCFASLESFLRENYLSLYFFFRSQQKYFKKFFLKTQIKCRLIIYFDKPHHCLFSEGFNSNKSLLLCQGYLELLKFLKKILNPYINFAKFNRKTKNIMITSYNNFISYTNHITYIVLPSSNLKQYNTELNQNNSRFSPYIRKNEQNGLKIDHQSSSQRAQVTRDDHFDGFQNASPCESSSKKKSEPKKKNKEPTPKKIHNQKYGRNICSNIFHAIIKRVLYEKQYTTLIQKLMAKDQMQITLQEFYSKLYFKQNKLKQYVPLDKINEFYLGNKNKIKEGLKRHYQFCKILRVISRYYIENDHIGTIFDYHKLKKESKNYHIKERRKLYSIVDGSFKIDSKS